MLISCTKVASKCAIDEECSELYSLQSGRSVGDPDLNQMESYVVCGTSIARIGTYDVWEMITVIDDVVKIYYLLGTSSLVWPIYVSAFKITDNTLTGITNSTIVLLNGISNWISFYNSRNNVAVHHELLSREDIIRHYTDLWETNDSLALHMVLSEGYHYYPLNGLNLFELRELFEEVNSKSISCPAVNAFQLDYCAVNDLVQKMSPSVVIGELSCFDTILLYSSRINMDHLSKCVTPVALDPVLQNALNLSNVTKPLTHCSTDINTLLDSPEDRKVYKEFMDRTVRKLLSEVCLYDEHNYSTQELQEQEPSLVKLRVTELSIIFKRGHLLMTVCKENTPPVTIAYCIPLYVIGSSDLVILDSNIKIP